MKMKTVMFKDVLMQCHTKSNEEQMQMLENEFDAWRGRYDQVDDILVMGIRIG